MDGRKIEAETVNITAVKTARPIRSKVQVRFFVSSILQGLCEPAIPLKYPGPTRKIFVFLAPEPAFRYKSAFPIAPLSELRAFPFNPWRSAP